MFLPAQDQFNLASPRAWLAPAFLTLLVLSAAVVQQTSIGLDTDVSWLITVSERMLGGDRLYVDVVELNPPASVLIYLPWVALAGAFGVKAEALVAAFVVLLAGASLLLAGAILRRSGARVGWLVPIAAFAQLLLPGASFAQREHIALICLMPWLALMVARAEAVPIRSWAAVLAGIGAGLVIAIKPPFALAVGLPLLAAAVRRRSPKAILGPETWACGLVVLFYAALVLLAFPEFAIMVLPLIGEGYLQVRSPLGQLIGAPLPLLTLLLAGTAAYLQRERLGSSPALMPLLGAMGFGLAMLVQGKGFSNHHIPALALSIVALGIAVSGRRTALGERNAGWAVLIAGGAAAAFVSAHMLTYPGAAALVRQVAPPRPAIIVAGTNLSIGHPLTRWVGGRWVGTSGALWVTGTARQLLDRTVDRDRRAKLQAQVRRDQETWLADVRRSRPDVILADGERGMTWLRSDPGRAAAARSYRVAGQAEGIVVLVRFR